MEASDVLGLTWKEGEILVSHFLLLAPVESIYHVKGNFI